MRSLRSDLLAILAVVALGGCEPAGPGVSGQIRLKEGRDGSGFSTLSLRAFPDATSSFDKAAVPAGVGLTGRADVSTITFPHRYHVEQAMGASNERDWRLVAWLSNGDAPEHPEPSDPWCTTRFVLGDCDGFGGYCGTTGGVDCTLE